MRIKCHGVNELKDFILKFQEMMFQMAEADEPLPKGLGLELLRKAIKDITNRQLQPTIADFDSE